jgi:hypothetical protein
MIRSGLAEREDAGGSIVFGRTSRIALSPCDGQPPDWPSSFLRRPDGPLSSVRDRGVTVSFLGRTETLSFSFRTEGLIRDRSTELTESFSNVRREGKLRMVAPSSPFWMDDRGTTRLESFLMVRSEEESLSRSLMTLRSLAAPPSGDRLVMEDRSSSVDSFRPPALKLFPTLRRLSRERTPRALTAVAPSRLIEGRRSG